jgi:SAM-dependent methyltransferase
MLKRLYRWLLQKTAKSEDRGGPSAGYWQGRIRDVALSFCEGMSGLALDVGCGEGLLLRRLLKSDPRIKCFGIDLSHAQLREAEKKIAERTGSKAGLAQANAIRLPFGNNTFDRVTALNLMICMPTDHETDELIKEVSRVCKDGGRIIFDIRNVLSPLIYIKYKLAPLYDGTAGALRTYHPDRLEEKLEVAGLRVTKRSFLGFLNGRFAPVIVFEIEKRKRQ